MNVPFTKMHGLGNDFILVEEDQLPPALDLEGFAVQICDRHFGVGADGLIVVAPPTDPNCAIQFMIYNADGSQPEMCGNGIRCFARYVRDQGLIKANVFTVETLAGPITPTLLEDGSVEVDMGPPTLRPAEVPIRSEQEESDLHHVLTLENGMQLPLAAVSMGNPHAVIFRQEVKQPLDYRVIGPMVETHPNFPAKTNVEFVEVLNRHTVEVKVWERGSGATLACGTGACAVTVAGILTKRLDSPVQVMLPGGSLTIQWAGGTAPVKMTGPAQYVFAGTYPVQNKALLLTSP